MKERIDQAVNANEVISGIGFERVMADRTVLKLLGKMLEHQVPSSFVGPIQQIYPGFIDEFRGEHSEVLKARAMRDVESERAIREKPIQVFANLLFVRAQLGKTIVVKTLVESDMAAQMICFLTN